MKLNKWEIVFSIMLLALSSIIYLAFISIFGDVRYMTEYSLLHLAFIPLDVFFVTIIIEKLLDEKRRKETMDKLNIISGIFFGEMENDFFIRLKNFSEDFDEIKNYLIVKHEWGDREYVSAMKNIMETDFKMKCDTMSLMDMKIFILSKEELILSLLSNPALLEHDRLTDMLWSIFHLADEFDRRDDLTSLPESDVDHLLKDIKRAYINTFIVWFDYLKHMKSHYPYLYSLAVRANPFNDEGIIIKDNATDTS